MHLIRSPDRAGWRDDSGRSNGPTYTCNPSPTKRMRTISNWTCRVPDSQRSLRVRLQSGDGPIQYLFDRLRMSATEGGKQRRLSHAGLQLGCDADATCKNCRYRCARGWPADSRRSSPTYRLLPRRLRDVPTDRYDVVGVGRALEQVVCPATSRMAMMLARS